MQDQDWINQHLEIILAFYVVALWILVAYVLALASGWRRLARRFRFRGIFQGEQWSMQSASMRVMMGYNHVLTVGADSSGLFLRPIFLFRTWHPPLFVPWTEITFQRKKQFFFDVVEFRLGREEEIPLVVRKKLANRIEAAGGKAWSSLPIT